MSRSIVVSLAAAAAGFVGLAIGLAVDPGRVSFAWLDVFAFGATTAIGALLLEMIGHVSKAGWLAVLRRINEAIAGTLPLFAVFLVLVLLYARRIYPWVEPAALEPAERAAVEAKGAYLNLRSFVVRAVLEMGVFVVLASVLRRWSLAGDSARRPATTDRLRALSGAGLPVAALALTFAAFDWLMSLQPDWYSTMFGFYVFAGGMAGAVGLVAAVAALEGARGRLSGTLTPDHTHALGRVLLTFVIFWAYVAFGQLVIIWMADEPAEISFYAARVMGRWTAVTWLLVMGHFVAPFFLLLSKDLKRHPGALGAVGAWVFAMHYVDVYWLVLPVHDRAGARPHWTDLAALLAVGGSSAALAIGRYRRGPPLPLGDPELGAGLRYEAAP